jgi:hypothetical protein
MTAVCANLSYSLPYAPRSFLGRIQLFETMKREGAGTLENVVMPQGSDAEHRPVTSLRKGWRRGNYNKVEIHKGQDPLILHLWRDCCDISGFGTRRP